MAKVPCKGTALKITISMALTSIAQVISLDLAKPESETYDSSTLDNSTAFKTYDPTGYVEPGEISGELFYDPANSSQKALSALVAAPAANAGQILLADTGATTMAFSATGFSLGATVAMNDGLKGEFKLKVSGNPGYPTS
jgi:hypothetical protein